MMCARRRSFVAGLSVFCMVAVLSSAALAGMDATFTYQGQLERSGTPFTGALDMRFALYEVPTNGIQLSLYSQDDVSVEDGLFTVDLYYSNEFFDGRPLWLEISMSPDGSSWTTLSPRQAIQPAPYALFAFDGAGSGDSYWEPFGSNIYYNTGRVGVGTTSMTARVHVIDPTSYAVTGECVGEGTVGHLGSEYAGVHGEGYMGVYGESNTVSGTGVSGYAYNASGSGKGVSGECGSADGSGVYGRNYANTGQAIGVHGRTSSDVGFGGYFEGRGYFSSRVGIGTENPAEMLDVAGTAKVSGLQVGTSATPGHVLTANASGVGTWQEPTGDESVWSTNGSNIYYAAGNVGVGTSAPAAKLHVNGSFRSTGFQMATAATDGYVLTCNSSGVGTWQEPATSPAELDLPYSDELSSAASGIWIKNTGTGFALRGEGEGDGDGVKGEAEDGYGVWGYSQYGRGVYGSSTHGTGVHAWSYGTGTTNTAIYAHSANSNGIAIFSTSDSTDANSVFVNKGTGDIIRGFSGDSGGDMVFRVENDGTTSVGVLKITGGADLSEGFEVTSGEAKVTPGMVVCIDPERPGQLIASSRCYDRTVAGVISGAGGVAPGMLMSQKGSVADGEHPVALTGRVFVQADASQGSIEPGDLLTTSNVPGHAMKVTDHTKAQGAILGKAMTSLDEGRGLVLVLVSLQ